MSKSNRTPRDHVAELARLRQQTVELIAEMDAAKAAPDGVTRVQVDAFGDRYDAIRAALDAIEATS